jgi:alpha-mannosidase
LIDPTLQPVPYPVLQPIFSGVTQKLPLEGNWYVQPGDHHFHFSLFVHAPGWQQGWRMGISANHTLVAVVTEPTVGADLPPDRSYFGIAANNVMITTIKKAEDGDAVVMRCVEIEGRDTETDFTSVFPVAGAQRTDMIERNGAALPLEDDRLTLTIGHHAIETFRLEL